MLSFTLSLLLAVAQGAPAPKESPALTSTATLPATTSDTYTLDGEIPVYCSDGRLQYCSRSELPYYANGQVGDSFWINPYTVYGSATGTANETSTSLSCQSAFYTAFNEYYMTAPITFGEEIPASTEVTGYTSMGTFTNFWSSPLSTGLYTTTHTGLVAETTGPGETTEIQTVVNSDGIQVLSTVTENFSTVSWVAGLYTSTWVPAVFFTNPSVSVVVVAAHTPATFLTNFVYTASRGSGCCRDCSLFGNSVQVYFWPTPAPAVADRTLVNSDNFTFVYPTLYIGLQSLYATDQCGTISGQVVASTTIPIPEENLSTAIAYRYNTTQYPTKQPNINPFYTSADFGKQQTESCSDITTSLWFAGYGGSVATTTFVGGEFYTVTYNPCSPTLSVPTELFTLNPAWSTCIPGIRGLYDPPYTLQRGSGLVALGPTSTTSSIPETTNSPAGVPTTKTTSTPSPANTLKSPTPTSTSVQPTKTTAIVKPDQPPSSNDPGTSPTQSEADPGQPTPGTTHSDTGTPVQGTNPVDSNQQSTSAVVVGTQTLIPGGPAVTISGTTVSLDASGSSLVIDGTTQNLPSFISSGTAAEFIVGSSQTLIQGASAITVSGTAVSLVPGGSSVVLGGSVTELLSSFLGGETETATGGGIAGVIATVGGFSSVGSNGNYTGPSASGGRKETQVWVWGVLLSGGLLGVWLL